jgi:hypothetical protein
MLLRLPIAGFLLNGVVGLGPGRVQNQQTITATSLESRLLQLDSWPEAAGT